ncbi:MAG: LemA family protein [Eubacterium sp.]
MSSFVWVITAIIVFVCIAVVAIFYNLTKMQEEIREKYLKVDSYRVGKWNMAKRLLEHIENYNTEGTKYEKAHEVLDKDFMTMGKEEKILLYHQMEEILGRLILVVREQSNLQCERKIRMICMRLKEEAPRYHAAEAEYDCSVTRYNRQIEKAPDKYVAKIFGLKKQAKLG